VKTSKLPPDQESHSRANGKTTEGKKAGFSIARIRTTVLGKDFKGALTHVRFPDVLVVLSVKLEGCKNQSSIDHDDFARTIEQDYDTINSDHRQRF
jgi:hypothetical protein